MSTTLLRIELRRNAVLLLLPVMALLVWFSPVRVHLGTLALWPERSIDLQSALQGAAPLFTGVAAWMGGRERRHEIDDLLATIPRSAWSRLLTTLTATTLWGLLFYLVVAGLVLAVTAAQATWGGPVPWPLLTSLLTLPALAAVGFALGHLLPGRFTPALAAVSVFVVFFGGVEAVKSGANVGFLIPIYPSVPGSVWYADGPDRSLIQVLFLVGLIIAALGSLGLTGHKFRPPRTILWFAPILIASGAALTVTSVILVLQLTTKGVEVPLFGDVATGAAIPYTPVCNTGPVPVCVHPAYQSQLPETAVLINRLAAPVVGLPDAPDRAEQRPSAPGIVRRGRNIILDFAPLVFHDPTTPPQIRSWWDGQIAMNLAADHAPVGYPLSTARSSSTVKAQSVVALYLLRQAHVPFDSTQFASGRDVIAAEERFVALSIGARRRWLRSHYLPLRQGRVPLRNLP